MMMLIRHAIPADNARARDIVRHSLQAFAIEAEFEGLDRAIGAIGREDSPNAIELVAEWRQQVCACLAIQDLGHGCGKLSGFHADAACRGHGIGRALLSRAIDEARQHGLSRLTLDTCAGMHAAIRLYQSLGWQRIADPSPDAGADRSYVLTL